VRTSSAGYVGCQVSGVPASAGKCGSADSRTIVSGSRTSCGITGDHASSGTEGGAMMAVDRANCVGTRDTIRSSHAGYRGSQALMGCAIGNVEGVTPIVQPCSTGGRGTGALVGAEPYQPAASASEYVSTCGGRANA
jgi:hypothetical protein